jgi:hypothetical protein
LKLTRENPYRPMINKVYILKPTSLRKTGSTLLKLEREYASKIEYTTSRNPLINVRKKYSLSNCDFAEK